MGDGASNYSIGDLAVLVVDDHRMNREFLETGLSRVAARVTLAEDGPAAIACCRREDFDVILMDLHMPRMDGLATALRIRDLDDPSARARMVALTADARPEERARLLEAGFDEYLNKPVGIGDLVTALERLFNPAASPRVKERPASPARLIDRNQALAAANGDGDLAGRLQAMLATELDEKLPELERLLLTGELNAAADLLHQWAGAGGYAGADRLSQACAMLRQRLISKLDSSPGTACVHFLRTAHATRQSLRRA